MTIAAVLTVNDTLIVLCRMLEPYTTLREGHVEAGSFESCVVIGVEVRSFFLVVAGRVKMNHE